LQDAIECFKEASVSQYIVCESEEYMLAQAEAEAEYYYYLAAEQDYYRAMQEAEWDYWMDIEYGRLPSMDNTWNPS
jgi:hypothetical protein